MKNRRMFLTVVAVALVAVFMLSGTMAWLTDQDTKTNTVRIADVGTTPDEPHFPPEPPTVYPGVPQAKDPTITVDAGSEPVYIRVLVKINTQLFGLMEPATNVTFTGGEGTEQWEITGSAFPTANSPWVKNGNGTVDGDYTYLEYRYPIVLDGFNDSGEAEAFTIETPVFSGFRLKTGAKVEDFNTATGDPIDMRIIVVSQCIQAAGFDDAETAFTALGSIVYDAVADAN